jgi:hypothetical protein
MTLAPSTLVPPAHAKSSGQEITREKETSQILQKRSEQEITREKETSQILQKRSERGYQGGGRPDPP